MPATSQTNTYDALLSTTLFNYSATLEDQISKTNVVTYQLKQEGGYITLDDVGERMQLPLMYQLGQADAYSGYDVMPDQPMDGITSAFYQWRLASIPIVISGEEELKNAGEARILSLLEGKTTQAEMGMQEFFTKGLLWGNGGNGGTIITPYVSPYNGASFIEPLPKLVAYDPTASYTIGEVNQADNTWWRNQFHNNDASTFLGFLRQIETMRNNCSKGVGQGTPKGTPNLHITDQSTYELYCAALRSKHENPSYAKADFPFENVAFFKKPVVWDELMPDWAGASTSQSAASGTWLMLNTNFMKMKVHSKRNFATTPFMPALVNGQDAKKAYILWFGGLGVSNRRKQGVEASINTAITS